MMNLAPLTRRLARLVLLLVLPLAAAMALGAAPPAFLLQSQPKRLEPFPESRLQLNPPTFRWPAGKESAPAYRIELARRPDFSDARTEIVHDLWFRPLAPLEPGVWYWRCRAETAPPGPWQGPESFAITAELAPWPIPAWADLLAQVPRSHPRVYVRADEVPALRANARRLAADLAPHRERVERALAAPFDLASYQARVPAGADPNAGESQARKLLIWESKAAAIAAASPAAEGAWLWLATGDRALLAAVKRRALEVAAFDPQGFITERNTGADAANIDFGNAVLVHDLGVIYDLLHAELTAAERQQIRAAILARAAPIFAKVRRCSQQLMRAHAWQHGFLDALVGALAIYGEEPVAADWAEAGLKAFVAFYPWFGGNDGGSQEGTRYYHGPEFLATLNTLDVLRSAFGLRLEDGNPWFRANPYFLIYSFPPGQPMARLGDSNAGQDDETDDLPEPTGKARLVAQRMAELYGNGHAAAYAAALPKAGVGFTVSEVLRWSNPPVTPPVALATLPAARVFRDIGAVYTHSALAQPAENVRLVFHSSPYGGHGHSHADQNSFHVIAYGEDLLLDSGYYTPTGDPHRQQWSVRTKAHNTMLVDGTGQPWGDPTGYGRIGHFETQADWTYFIGHAATAYREAPLDRFDRHVLWLRGTEVQTYVIVDDLAAANGAARRFDWLLHAARKLEVDEGARRVTARGEKGRAVVTFLAPSALTFQQDDRFDAPAVYWRKGQNFPLPNQWHLQAAPPAAVEARFVTVIQISRPDAALTVPRLVDGVVTTAGWRVTLPVAGARLTLSPTP